LGIEELCDDLVGGVKGKTGTCPFVLMMGDFVTPTYIIAIPTATGVGEVECCVEIGVKIGFVGYAQCMVVKVFPKVAAVERASWGAMHADRSNGDKIPEALKVLAEISIGSIYVAIAGSERFVVVAYLVSQGGYFRYYFGIKTLRHCTEVVCGFQIKTVFK
jgi:hypothetical protein